VAVRLHEREATALFFTHSETSTGVVLDPQPFAAAAREAGALSVVDAVSSLGAVPLETDAWGLDVVASGAQKALMTPPGLAMTTSSPAAWERVCHRDLSTLLLGLGEDAQGPADPRRARYGRRSRSSAGLDVALGMLLEEGLEAAFDRHRRLGRACREGLKAMGLQLSSPDDDSSAVVTAAYAPEGVGLRRARPAAARPPRCVTLAPGQGELKGKIFRIGHIGYYDVFRHHDRPRRGRAGVARARRRGRARPSP